MEKLKELLETDGKKAQAFVTDSLARAFVDFSDGAIETEYHGQFKKIEIFMIVKRRGQ